MLLLFCLDSYSQQVIPKRNHAINYSFSQHDVPDTLTIVAVRVEFQQDDNRLTTGDGTFDTNNLSYLDKPEVTIDPLPHDKSYFESHLLFAKNYFEKVSGNQITVEYRVLSDVYQLPKKMEAYSPTGEQFTNEKVADLAKDTWHAVEQQGGFATTDLNPDKTAFAIFHAGVGRDIQLTGTTLDKTPQDIPSLFFGQQSLSDLLNEPDFDGFDINGGTFKITNSLILPRTLSRRGEDFNGNEFVLQLSINGLLCASVGSYLGLPDLFNTETGASGIGRFGLMDGASFFSYRGLFPPEPSAWEKIYLGWQTPFSITTGISGDISLPAASLHQSNSIAKYSLSGNEYFLIENRYRDPDNYGVTLTFQQPNGTLQTKQFDNYNEAFVNQTENFEELITGVVTDVSNFDWSLPGGLDPGPDESAGTADDRLLNGGILIWHIDEAVIEKELSSQTVNANPERRGVDLEEADGAQDIGQAANDDFSHQARGTSFDFWWDGNNASVVTLDGDTLSFYENKFGPDTRPSNKSNSGAPGFFELYDFSENQATANFRIRSRSANNILSIPLSVDTLDDQTTFTATDADYFSSYPLGISLLETQADSFLIIPSQQSTYAVSLNDGSNPIFDFQSGPHQQPFLSDNLILGDIPSGPQIELTSWQWDGSDWSAVWNAPAQANDGFMSSINVQTLLLDFTDQRINLSNGSFQTSLSEATQRSASLDGHYTSLAGNNLILNPENNSYSVNTTDNRLYTGALELSNNQTAFYLLSDADLKIFQPTAFDQPRIIVQNTPLEWPALTDINNDGQTDFIFVNKETNALEARNINGALLSNFPIRPPEGSQFIGTPLIATSKQSDETILFVTAQDSLSMQIYAYRSGGQPVEGFPLFAGSISSQENQPVHPIIQEQTLYTISHRGELKSWRIDFIDKVLWGSRYGNSTTNKVSGHLDTEEIQNPSPQEEILSDKETYNWPNPAEDFTHLRFQTAESGVVDVKIITPAGSVVFNERYQANGSVPQEHRISTQNWSSGLYFAMITATIDGEKARKMLKIVVVR